MVRRNIAIADPCALLKCITSTFELNDIIKQKDKDKKLVLLGIVGVLNKKFQRSAIVL